MHNAAVADIGFEAWSWQVIAIAAVQPNEDIFSKPDLDARSGRSFLPFAVR
jgi:hypothetical protein